MLSCLDKINNGQNTIKANSFFEDKYFNERPDLEIFAKQRNWNIDFFKISPEDVINNFDEFFILTMDHFLDYQLSERIC